MSNGLYLSEEFLGELKQDIQDLFHDLDRIYYKDFDDEKSIERIHQILGLWTNTYFNSLKGIFGIIEMELEREFLSPKPKDEDIISKDVWEFE